MAVEYAPLPKNGPKIFLGENRFWSKSGAQNAQNLDFSKIFESCHFQLHHTPEWAKSDRNSLMWLNLKSELVLRFFRFFENEKNLGDMRMDLVGICKMSGKKPIFFRAKIDLLKSPEINFYHFLTTLSRLITSHQIWRK